MKIEKKYLQPLFLAIQGTDGVLSLADARVKDIFFKELTEKTVNFENDRKAIYEKFCKKNEEGQPDISGDEYKFDASVLDELNKELEILYSESVKIETPAKLKEFIEATQYKPKNGETELIDAFLANIK